MPTNEEKSAGEPWKHEESADGPIFVTANHKLMDLISGTPYDDPWENLQLPGFIQWAKKCADEVISEAEKCTSNSRNKRKEQSLDRTIKDARSVLSLVRTLHLVLKHGGSERSFARGIELGRTFERMIGRAAEYATQSGRKASEGASKGGATASKKDKAPANGWEAAVRSEMVRDISYTRACGIVGSKNGCTGRTVSNYVPKKSL